MASFLEQAQTLARQTKTSGYDEAMLVRHLYYRGITESLLDADLLKYFLNSHDDMHKVMFNVVQPTIDGKSTLYNGPATRMLVDERTGERVTNKAHIRLVDRLYEMAEVDEGLQEAERLAELMTTTSVKIWSRRNHSEIVLEVIPSYSFDVAPYEFDPQWIDHPDATVMVTLGETIESGSSEVDPDTGHRLQQSANPNPSDLIEVWTNDTFAIYRGGREVAFDNHQYNGKPFVMIWGVRTSELFPVANDDIVQFQRAVNLMATDIQHGSRFAVWPETVYTGRRDAKTIQNLASGPDFIKALPPDSQYQKISVDPNMDKLLDGLVGMLKVYSQSKGLGVDTFTLDQKAISGVAKMNDLRATIEQRRAKIPRWVTYERRIFGKLRDVWNAHNPVKIPEHYTINVEFADLFIPQDPLHAIQVTERELALNLTDHVAELMKKNNLTRPAAQAKFDEYKENNAENSAVADVKAAMGAADNDANLVRTPGQQPVPGIA